MSIKGNIEICVDTCFGPKRPVDRCNARTRRGTECQKPPIKGKRRCRLHGGLSTGPKTAEGRARIAAAHYRHGRRSKKFAEMRAKIWKELREIEARMRADGLI
jgi:hypothetical protein